MRLTQADLDRVHYLCYRCYRCGRLLTKVEIARRWKTLEAGKVRNATLCPCGSRHITPTNPKWWEELLLPRVWVLWWKCVRGKRAALRKTASYGRE